MSAEAGVENYAQTLLDVVGDVDEPNDAVRSTPQSVVLDLSQGYRTGIAMILLDDRDF